MVTQMKPPNNDNDKLVDKLTRVKSTSLTPQEQQKLLLKQLTRQQAITSGEYTIGKLKTWKDFSNSAGFTPSDTLLKQEFTGRLVKEAFAELKGKIERGELQSLLSSKSAKSVVVNSPTVQSINEVDQWETDGGKVTDVVTPQGEPSVTPTAKRPKAEDPPCVYKIPVLHDNPRVRYIKLQERYACETIYGFFDLGYRAQALSGGVGVGKTYVIGATIVELYRRGWKPLQDSYSMFPVLYITRAPIIEQTERVLRDRFGLKLGSQVHVTNIEQLRCDWGKQLFKEKIVHQDGIDHVVYEWHPLLPPALTILDESHAVKNPDSKQSKIMQALNDVTGPHHMLFASATLFTRVIEAKVFACGTQLEW